MSRSVIFMIFFLVIILTSLCVVVLSYVASWKLYVKAGRPGWEAIVPYYNNWVLSRICGVSSWWIVILFILSFLSVIPILGLLFSLASLVAAIYYSIIISISMARAFGQSDSYALGYIFLSPIFLLITAFGKAKFVGNDRAVNDPIGKEIDKFLVAHNIMSGYEKMNASK